MEQDKLSIDDRIANLQAILDVINYELYLLMQQREYHPIGFTLGNTDGKKREKRKEREQTPPSLKKSGKGV